MGTGVIDHIANEAAHAVFDWIGKARGAPRVHPITGRSASHEALRVKRASSGGRAQHPTLTLWRGARAAL
jgi:hypothetical protein